MAASMPASQLKKPSIVAMFGWIIPEPLAIPPIRTVRPPELSLNSRLFVHKICGENRLRSSSSAAVRQRRNQRSQGQTTALALESGRRSHRGANQHGLRIKAQLVCNGLRRSLTIQQATVSSAGVGLARVDQHGSQSDRLDWRAAPRRDQHRQPAPRTW
jgi:hypothetical protein